MNVWDLFAVFGGDVFCSFSPFQKYNFLVYLCKNIGKGVYIYAN
jgi:hypothetical protein